MFAPHEFLELAKALRLEPVSISEQARWRGALSRAYYAAFLQLRYRIEMVHGPGSLGRTDVHGTVIRRLKSTRENHMKRLAEQLERLREQREIGDYDVGRSVTERDVDAALARAGAFMGNLGTLPDTKIRSMRL